MSRLVARHRKPDLSRFQTRQLTFHGAGTMTRQALEVKLVQWMSEVVGKTNHPNTIRGMAPARYLVMSAEGIDSILEAPVDMALGGGPKHTVYAKYSFAGMHDGSWYVEHVKFFPKLSDLQKEIAQRAKDDDAAATKQRYLDRAAAENALHPKAKAFRCELFADSWLDDIKAGGKSMQKEVDYVYEFAKKAASIPENFYTPKDMVKDAALMGLGKGVSAAGATTARAEKLAEAYEFADKAVGHYENVAEAWEKTSQQREEAESKDILAQSQRGVFHKTGADTVVEGLINEASQLPGAGPFVKMFAGMFFDFASANYAGEVAKIRGRCYAWFIAGYIHGLAQLDPDGKKKVPIDEYFYRLAYNRSSSMKEQQKFQEQMFLLAYSSQHYLVGTTAAGEKMEHPDKWVFPDGFLAHWSPERLGRTMATILRTKHYLVD